MERSCTHTEVVGFVRPSVSGTKDQRALAGMHVPTAAIARTSHSVFGIIGPRQHVLSRGGQTLNKDTLVAMHYTNVC